VGTIVEVDPVVGIEGDEVHIIRQSTAAGAKNGIDNLRRGNEARAHVEDVAPVLELVSTSPDLVSLLQKCDLHPCGL
jgi:hypothetical protein